MFAIWFTVGVIIAFMLFSVAILPGVNVPGIPVVLVASTAIHLGMFLWIMWTFITEPEESFTSSAPKTSYSEDGTLL
tara:strand:- start:1179 stop:1409 length:231 start_codon:yes stop_codon:yes gene_type:complete